MILLVVHLRSNLADWALSRIRSPQATPNHLHQPPQSGRSVAVTCSSCRELGSFARPSTHIRSAVLRVESACTESQQTTSYTSFPKAFFKNKKLLSTGQKKENSEASELGQSRSFPLLWALAKACCRMTSLDQRSS